MVGGKFTVIPEKLFLTTNYTYTMSTSKWDLGCTPAGCQYTGLAVYPDVHNKLSRLDVQAKYMLDDTIMRNAGLAGKAYVKARVLWEHNSNDSWQSLQDQYGYLVNPTNLDDRVFDLDGHRQSELRRGAGSTVLRREVVSWL